MIRHYIITASRSLIRQKWYSLLNILGLSIGITCALLIFLYVYDELTYDRNHAKWERIYRLNGGYDDPTTKTFTSYACIGAPLGGLIGNEFPEIEQVVRMRRWTEFVVEKPSTKEQFTETIFVADSTFFNIFTYPFIAGKTANALDDANTVVISRKMAMKYFNRIDVVGESIKMQFFPEPKDLKITGVMEDYPSNTHLKPDFVVSMGTNPPPPPQREGDGWFRYGYYTYLLLKPNTDVQAFEEKIRHVSRRFIAAYEDKIGYKQIHFLTPVADIHLHADLQSELEPGGNASYVYFFLMIGFFILIIACINFMNLATARSMNRAKEIGIRKVVGAARTQLVRQFLGEAFLMTALAVTISVGAASLLLPYVNDLTSKALQLINNPIFWSILLGIVLFVSLLSGSYPALFLSAFKPVETLKGKFSNSAKGSFLRKALVVFQFCISIFLIAGTLIIVNHLQYLRSKELGFNKEQVLYINSRSMNGEAIKTFKEQLKSIPGVVRTSVTWTIPGLEMGNNVVRKGWNEGDPLIDMSFNFVDYNFVELYDLKLIEGRSFREDFATDPKEAFLINETGMKLLGFANAQEAIGQKLEWGDRKGRVIGVLKDFHYQGTNLAIQPFFLILNDGLGGSLSIKIANTKVQHTISQIESTYKALMPNRTFEYSFLDEDFDKQYQAEERFMRTFTLFAIIAIIIACLGLYGLSMFMAEQRTKEVGVRKVLGASEKSIVALLSKDFLQLVTIAFVITIPLAYWAMEQWLRTFPYREAINPLLFVITCLIVLAITLFTVSYQAIQAAKTNPVKTLRSE